MKKYICNYDAGMVHLTNIEVPLHVTIREEETHKELKQCTISHQHDTLRKQEEIKHISQKETDTPKAIRYNYLTNNEKLKTIYDYILRNPGCKQRDIVEFTTFPQSSAERYLKILRDKGYIAYRGNRQSGGYHITEKP